VVPARSLLSIEKGPAMQLDKCLGGGRGEAQAGPFQFAAGFCCRSDQKESLDLGMSSGAIPGPVSRTEDGQKTAIFLATLDTRNLPS